MKKVFVLIMITLTSLFASDLKWHTDIKTAQEEARENNQTLMIFVESRSCRWCKKMERVTFADEMVRTKLEKMVLVRLMREDRKSLEDFPYVKWVPTMFFVAPNLEIKTTITGYFDANDFLSYLDEMKLLK